MKNLLIILLFLSSALSSVALVTNKVEWIRNEIANKTPKTEVGYLGDKMIYQIGGEKVGMRCLYGISTFFADQVYSNLNEEVFYQFYNDTNTAVKAVGLLCLARAKIDYKILEGNETAIFRTHPSCALGHVTTLEEFSRDLKYDPWTQWYYRVISIEEYDAIVELRKSQTTETNTPNQILDPTWTTPVLKAMSDSQAGQD